MGTNTAISQYDVVEITDDMTDYDAENIGRIAVQRNGELAQFAADLDEARNVIAGKLGQPVELTEGTNYFAGRRWVVALGTNTNNTLVVEKRNASTGGTWGVYTEGFTRQMLGTFATKADADEFAEAVIAGEIAR